MHTFNLLNIKTEELYQVDNRIWVGSENDADTMLASLNIINAPPIYRKKVVVTRDWLQRECDEIYNDNVKLPIWFDDGSIQRHIFHDRYDGFSAINMKNTHFAIVSQSDPLFISYFPDEEKGMLNKRVKIAPGKYLKKYFSHVYNDLQIEEYANKHKEKYSPVEIHWASTPEEIVQVYKMPHEGFNSCMQKQDDVFRATIKRNPTYVYGAGDLSLAYTVNSEGRLTTRALVWKDKNKVGRVYGDPFIIRSALAKQGIVTNSDNSDYDVFEGARLLKEFYTYDNKKMVIAPYIDGLIRHLEEDGDYLVISKEGRYHAEWTDGLARPRPFCERLQEYVSETVMVLAYNEADQTYSTVEWSRDTAESYMVYLFRIDNTPRYTTPNNPNLVTIVNHYGDDKYFLKDYIEANPNQFWTSDISGKLHYSEWTDKVMVEGKAMTSVEADDNSFVSNFDQVRYLNANKVKVDGAGFWHIDQASKHATPMIEGDDTMFKLKRGFVFMGGRVTPKNKISAGMYRINYEGANHLALTFGSNFEYVRRNHVNKFEYKVGDVGILTEIDDGYWLTNVPRALVREFIVA